LRFARFFAIVGLLTPWAYAQFLPIVTVSPAEVAAGSGDTTLTISGDNVASSFQVLWNGQPRSTRLIDSRTLKAVITRADLATPGLAHISIQDTSQNAPAADPVPFLIYLPLKNYDMVYDSTRSRLYVTVSKQDPNGPSLAIVNPDTGTVDRFILLSSEPGALGLSDDSEYLYVSLRSQVLRMDLTGASPQLTIDVSPFSQQNNLSATAVFPLPGQGSSAVVLMSNLEPGGTLVVFDNATPRTYTGQGNCIVGGANATTIYLTDNAGYDPSETPLLSTRQLTSSGFPMNPPVLPSQDAVVQGHGCPIYANGLVYDGDGDAIDPTVPAILGRFGASGLVNPAPELGTAYMVGGSGGVNAPALNAEVITFNLTTFAPIQSVSLPIPQSVVGLGRLIHWGQTGVGFPEVPAAYIPSDLGAPPFSWIHLIHVP
jgi:hypothetical protein